MSKECPKEKNKDAKLERQGWTRQFVADESRLSEAVELYESIGYKVRLEPAIFDKTSEQCKKCLLYQDCSKYKTIYIRAKKNRWKGKEETVIP